MALWKGFILLCHFVAVKEFGLLWGTSYLLSAPLMIKYLRISFKIIFALNEQKKQQQKNPVKWGCMQVLTLQNQKAADEEQRYFRANLILKIKLQPKG